MYVAARLRARERWPCFLFAVRYHRGVRGSQQGEKKSQRAESRLGSQTSSKPILVKGSASCSSPCDTSQVPDPLRISWDAWDSRYRRYSFTCRLLLRLVQGRGLRDVGESLKLIKHRSRRHRGAIRLAHAFSALLGPSGDTGAWASTLQKIATASHSLRYEHASFWVTAKVVSRDVRPPLVLSIHPSRGVSDILSTVYRTNCPRR